MKGGSFKEMKSFGFDFQKIALFPVIQEGSSLLLKTNSKRKQNCRILVLFKGPPRLLYL